MRNIGIESAPPPGMIPASIIGIGVSTAASSGAAKKGSIGLSAVDDVSAWTSVLEAHELSPRVQIPDETAQRWPARLESVCGSNDTQGVRFQLASPDLRKFEVCHSSRYIIHAGVVQGSQTAVAINSRKVFGPSGSTWAKSVRDRNPKRAREEFDRRQIGPISEMGIAVPPAVQVAAPENPKQLVGPSASKSNCHHSTLSGTQNRLEKAQCYGGAVYDRSNVGPAAQSDPNGDLAEAGFQRPLMAAVADSRTEPILMSSLHESDPHPDRFAGQDARGTRDTHSEDVSVATENRIASAQEVGRAISPRDPTAHSDHPNKERLTAGLPRRESGSVVDGKQKALNEGAVGVSTPVLREGNGVTSVEEKPINPARSSSRVSIDSFAIMNRERPGSEPSWIHVGVRHVEAGYLDPALGWVRVRAESVANAVHAALVPCSSEAAQALGGQLPGLNSYLSEHHSGTVTMDAPQSQWNGTDTHPGEHPSSQSDDRSRREEPAMASSPVLAHASVAVSLPNPAVISPGGGRYISVLA